MRDEERLAMNRSHAFDLCEGLLNLLCLRVESRAKLNLLNLNIHCEDFYAQLLNVLFGYALKNVNADQPNAEGIDLLDLGNKLLLQVSSTATKGKVNAALGKDLAAYDGYAFKFVSICKDAAHLRKQTYSNPHNLVFDPQKDIYDVPSLLSSILHMELSQQRAIYEFLHRELVLEYSPALEESNLAAIIGILSGHDLTEISSGATSVPFNVDDKIKQNNLTLAAAVIEDFKIHHHRVDSIYGEFDLAGRNKSKSVLDSFRTTYLKLATQYSGDELYHQIIERVTEKVKTSANYDKIPSDELELYVNVLAVDAFIRCKIFQEPKKKAHAPA